MKIAGTARLAAPRDQVWAAFHDPAVLARTLPGCNELRVVGDDSYEMTVTAGVAAIKGSYDGKVSIEQQDHPESFVLRASGAGAPGTVSADVTVRLAESEAGGTDLSYDADAVVGGPVGGVGQRMITGVAKKMAGQFFAAVDADIAGIRAPEPAAAAVAPGTPAVAGAVPAAGAVFAPPARSSALPELSGRDLLIGFVAGAAVALAGVLAGARSARRTQMRP